MTEEDVEKFLKMQAQITGLYKEIGLLSKKNPNDPVNKFKLKFINQSLDGANNLLMQQKPYEDFSIFVTDDLPTTSDVVMILEQYITALNKFKLDNTKTAKVENGWDIEMSESFWIINGKISNIHSN